MVDLADKIYFVCLSYPEGIATDMEQATGLEKKELDAKLAGEDVKLVVLLVSNFKLDSIPCFFFRIHSKCVCIKGSRVLRKSQR